MGFSRAAVDAQLFTLVDSLGREYSGFTETSSADHDRQTGRYTPGGADGDIVTVAQSVTGGLHTLTKPYDPVEYAQLKAISKSGNPEGSLVGVVVDANGRRIGNSSDRYTGVIKGVSRSPKRSGDGTHLAMSIRFEADGVRG